MIGRWISFAYDGNPNNAFNGGGPEWPEYKEATDWKQALLVEPGMSEEPDSFNNEQCDFWESINDILHH